MFIDLILNTVQNPNTQSNDWWDNTTVLGASIGVIGVFVGAVIGLAGNLLNNAMAYKNSKKAYKRVCIEEVYQLTLDIDDKVRKLPFAERYQQTADAITFEDYDSKDHLSEEFETLKLEIFNKTNRLQMLVDFYLDDLKKHSDDFIGTVHSIGAIKDDVYSAKIEKIFKEDLNEMDVGRIYLELFEKEPQINADVWKAKEKFLKKITKSGKRNY